MQWQGEGYNHLLLEERLQIERVAAHDALPVLLLELLRGAAGREGGRRNEKHVEAVAAWWSTWWEQLSLRGARARGEGGPEGGHIPRTDLVSWYKIFN